MYVSSFFIFKINHDKIFIIKNKIENVHHFKIILFHTFKIIMFMKKAIHVQ